MPDILDTSTSIRAAARNIAKAGLDEGLSDIAIQKIISAIRKFHHDPREREDTALEETQAELRRSLGAVWDWVPESSNQYQVQAVARLVKEAESVTQMDADSYQPDLPDN